MTLASSIRVLKLTEIVTIEVTQLVWIFVHILKWILGTKDMPQVQDLALLKPEC